MLNLICCMGNNNVIGKDGKMPWHLPEDLKWFKENTLNETVIMGRKTYESIGKPLPQRDNLILTRKGFNTEGLPRVWESNHYEVVQLNKKYPDKPFWVIGGADVYSQFLPIADKLYLTRITHDFEGDTFFPKFSYNDWTCDDIFKGTKDEKENPNQYDYYFMILSKKK